MPQLNPAPWLKMMVISWLFLLTIMFTKVTNFTPMKTLWLNHITPLIPWNWPWY
uniref:ATP synthase complex subunit 8 n=1 Tax=Crotaphatrema lamottei TaxID=1043697 RepID=K7NBY8_CROLA|nr:ATP synthase F0 subunit 8 [Crotaphatrema lamottei]AEK26860.1 ATP synthase F0 subunit 8 [Crotaphatrema lamottei]